MKGQNSNGQIFICGQTTDVRGTDGITPRIGERLV
jgi:hypothetical protein